MPFWKRKRRDSDLDFEYYEPEDGWSELEGVRNEINIHDAVQRREYVEGYLQQLTEAGNEVRSLQDEYKTVTARLKDIDLLDALPEEDKQDLTDAAGQIFYGSDLRERFEQRESRMSEEEYARMERLSPELESGIQKLTDANDYQRRIRNDLRRLDGERQAYVYRRNELLRMIDNARGLMMLCAGALTAVLIGLFVMGQMLDINVVYGYMIAVFLAAISVTSLYVNYTNAVAEKRGVASAIARLILLQNTVKIRYVNNRNLLDYLFLKYGTEKAGDLQKAFEKFQREKAEKERYARSAKDMEKGQRDLLYMLREYGIAYPDVFVHQPQALMDHREMVEIRHDLNARRQSLRQRMDYNRKVVAGNARSEIEDLARTYPQYAEEILDAVGNYSKNVTEGE